MNVRYKAYDALFRLKNEKHINIDIPLAQLASSEEVPESVMDFIKNNSYRTVDDFINVISRSKEFYRSIVDNYREDPSKYVKAFLSLVTNIEITIHKNPELRDELCKLFDIDNILGIVVRYVSKGENIEEVCECASRIRKIYGVDEKRRNTKS